MTGVCPVVCICMQKCLGVIRTDACNLPGNALTKMDGGIYGERNGLDG